MSKSVSGGPLRSGNLRQRGVGDELYSIEDDMCIEDLS